MLPFLFALCTLSLSAANFAPDAPRTAGVLRDFFQGVPFTSAVAGCFSNASSMLEEAPSQCLTSESSLEVLTESLGGDLANAETVQELDRISKDGNYSPQLLWDLDVEISFFRTWMSVFYGGNQFFHGQGPGMILPRLWLTPSPIGRLHTRGADNAGGPEIRLGQSCSNTNTLGLALQLDPELDENRRARDPRRQLLSSRPWVQSNVSQLFVSARITESSPTEVTGVGEMREQDLWENRVAMENVEQTDQTSPGPPYPRTHMLLFYRADWFEALNASVPDTWDELVSLAEALTRLSGFQGSSRAAGPEDFPEWNLDAWPDVEFTPVEPVELLQGLPANETSPKERAEPNSSLPRYALCLDLAPNCKGGWIFNAILASLSQTHGTWQGAFMDPISTDLLGETEPVLVSEAVRIYSRLTRSAAHQPSSAHSCALVNPLFASGACAMALDWDLAFPYVYNEPVLSSTPPGESTPYAQELVGKIGVAPLPGSTRVYDRQSASIVGCDEAVCPLATKHTVAEYVVEGEEAADAGTARDLQQQADYELGTWEDAGVRLLLSYDMLVNRAPFSGNTFGDIFFCNAQRDESGNPLFGLNIRALEATGGAINGVLLPMLNLEIFRGQVLETAFEALGPEVTRQAYALIGKQDVTGLNGLYQVHPALATPPPFPPEELSSWWAPNTTRVLPGLSALTHMYIHENDSSRYFDALWRARYSNRNQAPDLWTTRTLNLAYRHAVEELSVFTVASPDFSVESATSGFQKRCKEARASESSSKDAVQAAIWYTTGFNEGMISTADEERGDGMKDWVAGVISGLVVAFVLLLGCSCLAIAAVLRRRRVNWLGYPKAPGVGAGTTILHTDIEASTIMWETLPESVCDRALCLHNELIRTVLVKHKGYECGTEGDAFLLAFHAVADAVQFASEAQLQLMLAPWPKELLQLDGCRPVYVQPSTAVPLHQPIWGRCRKDSSSSLPAMPPSPQTSNNLPISAESTVPDGIPRKGAPTVSSTADTSMTTPLPSPYTAASQHTSAMALTAPTHNSSPLPVVLVSRKRGSSSSQRSGSLGSLFVSMLRTGKSKTEASSGAGQEQEESALSKALQSQQRPFSSRLSGGGAQPACHEAARQELEKRQSALSGLLCLDVALLEACLSGFAGDVGASDHKRVLHRTHSDDYALNLRTGTRSSTYLDAEWPAPEASLLLDNPTVGQRLVSSVPVVDGPGEGRMLVLRGLRVRMGMASSVERPEDVVLNKAQGRMEYKGRVVEATRAIVSAANGGQILMAADTFQQLPPAVWQRARILMAAMGDYVVQQGTEEVTIQLYQALPCMLCARAAHVGPLRSLRQQSLGFLSAPSDKAAVCYMNVCFFSALQLWNPEVADASLKIWSEIAQKALAEAGGYLVEAAGSLCLAVFTRPAPAIRWALDVIEESLHANWPEELLQTEYGETHCIASINNSRGRSGELSGMLPMQRTMPQQELVVEEKVLFRGLRIKVGIDLGPVMADLHPASGRVSYRGKVMNRAARISSLSKCGQVLCSENAWNSTVSELNTSKREREVTAGFIGSFKLKGIQEMINIYLCS